MHEETDETFIKGVIDDLSDYVVFVNASLGVENNQERNL